GRREIAEAVHQQVLEHDYIHPTAFLSPVVEDLAAALARRAPAFTITDEDIDFWVDSLAQGIEETIE
ncbi:MAG: hypothetical protein KAR15_02040, partial [Desulfobacterales bacterium]|nr:hypothetical protein [Desulfobacterales bacterium]